LVLLGARGSKQVECRGSMMSLVKGLGRDLRARARARRTERREKQRKQEGTKKVQASFAGRSEGVLFFCYSPQTKRWEKATPLVGIDPVNEPGEAAQVSSVISRILRPDLLAAKKLAATGPNSPKPALPGEAPLFLSPHGTHTP
jgi:hypothetical protein